MAERCMNGGGDLHVRGCVAAVTLDLNHGSGSTAPGPKQWDSGALHKHKPQRGSLRALVSEMATCTHDTFLCGGLDFLWCCGSNDSSSFGALGVKSERGDRDADGWRDYSRHLPP